MCALPARHSPKSLCTKMAQQDFSDGTFRFSPRWSLWADGGGGGGLLLRLAAVLMHPWAMTSGFESTSMILTSCLMPDFPGSSISYTSFRGGGGLPLSWRHPLQHPPLPYPSCVGAPHRIRQRARHCEGSPTQAPSTAPFSWAAPARAPPRAPCPAPDTPRTSGRTG